MYPFYAQEINLAPTTDIPADTTKAVVNNNELENWNIHLEKLEKNWDTAANKPYESWMKDAITIAIDTLRINKELAKSIKDSFINAIKKQNAELTTETVELISTFNNAIEKELQEPEKEKEVIEEAKKAEPSTLTIKPSIEASPESQLKSETPVAEAVTPHVETTTTETTTVQPEAEKPTTPEKVKEEPVKENLTQEWENSLSNMQKSAGNLYDLIDKAIEVAKKLRDLEGKNSMVLLQNFTHALEGAAVIRKLSPDESDDYINYFAQRINMYIPPLVKPKNHYQQQKSGLDTLQQKNIEGVQRKLVEQEKNAQSAAREAERQRLATIAKQEALRLEAEKRSSESQFHQLELNRIQAEQHASAQTLKNLQSKVTQLKDELNNAVKQKKAIAEKSLFTRAKETVTGLIWGPSETKSPEEVIAQKQEQLQQLTQEIEKEKEKLHQEAQYKSKKTKEAEQAQANINEKMVEKEQERIKELEKEEKEKSQREARNEFEKQRLEWRGFLTQLAEKKQSTAEDNKNATEFAINKATVILNLIRQSLPSKDIKEIIHVANGLKISFAQALVDQQEGNMERPNIFLNQDHFNLAINNFLDQIEKNQPIIQLIQ